MTHDRARMRRRGRQCSPAYVARDTTRMDMMIRPCATPPTACGVRCDTDIWGSERFPPAAW
eukprot:scaffold86935_cov51-Phaeocystis_antarctica.AAC.1